MLDVVWPRGWMVIVFEICLFCVLMKCVYQEDIRDLYACKQCQTHTWPGISHMTTPDKGWFFKKPTTPAAAPSYVDRMVFKSIATHDCQLI